MSWHRPRRDTDPNVLILFTDLQSLKRTHSYIYRSREYLRLLSDVLKSISLMTSLPWRVRTGSECVRRSKRRMTVRYSFPRSPDGISNARASKVERKAWVCHLLTHTPIYYDPHCRSRGIVLPLKTLSRIQISEIRIEINRQRSSDRCCK